MKKGVTFWTEGGNPTGMGHVSRCVNLAIELAARGVRSNFLINNDEAVRSRLEAESIEYAICPDNSPGAAKLCEAVVVIDSKKDLTALVKELKAAGKKVVVIENSTTEDADEVIMPSPVFDGACGQDGLSAGAEFVIMGRNSVKARVNAKPPGHGEPLRILVTMGGADPNNLTEFVVEALSEVKGIEVIAAVGPAAKPSRRLCSLMKERSGALSFVTGITDLAPLMMRSHIAFTAVGTSVYELAYMGVSSVIIANYEDDADYLKVFEALGFCESLGFYKNVRGGEVVRAVRMFIKDKNLWKAMSKNAKDLTDGNGAGRIADRIERLFYARPARAIVRAASSF